MLSPISPVSSRPASNKTQATQSPNPIRKPASVDQVRFSGTPQEPAKAPGWFKKYGWPTVGIVTGSTIAALGVPLHIIPVVGNAVGLGMNIVGGMIALFGVYKAFQAMNSNKSATTTGSGKSNSTSQPATPSQQSSSSKRKSSSGSGLLKAAALQGGIGGAAAGATSAMSSAVGGAIGDKIRGNDDDEKEDAKAESEHSNHGSDAGSEAGDDVSVDGDSDFGSDFDVDV
jgi:hypothetical protein